MANILLDYMTKRAESANIQKKELGPVITLSREYGCFATQTAQLLSTILSEKTKQKWSFITKEILEESAKELQVTKQDIAHLFGAEEKSFLGDIILSFSKNKYASDDNIKNTIQSVVRKYAENGNTIIVGRAGCVIARDIPASVHVKLTAPFNERVKRVMQRDNLTEDEARKKVIFTDDKRHKFMSFFKGDIPDSELFDLIINNFMLNEKQIVEIIIKLLEIKGVVK